MDLNSTNRKLLFYVTALTMFIYITWRALFTIPTQYGWLSLIAGIALLVSEAVAALEAFEHYRSLRNRTLPDLPVIAPEQYPEVDVLISTHNEATDLLFKTVNGCLHMDYPDKSKVHIYICDDSDRPEMAQLAAEMGVGYFGLSGNKLAKAGNINNALGKTSSPLIATFDADMIPTHDFLLKTAPYFLLPQMKRSEDGSWVKRQAEEMDPAYKIGFIQTPQSFYNPDLFQYNLYSENRIPNEQDYFFREINVGRNSSNSPIYAGSNTVISRQALEEVGGIVTGTITEDFATGLRIQARGYTCYAVPDVVAHGLSPTTMRDLIKQRERWGRGCVQTFRSGSFLLQKGLSFSSKASYVACLMYWWTFLRRLIYIASPIMFAVFHLRVVQCSMWQLLVFWLPSYLLYNYTLRTISGNIRTQRWSNIIDTIIFPFMIVPVFLESLGIKQRAFSVTNKENNTDESGANLAYAVPHLILILFSVAALFSCLSDAIRYSSVGNVIVIFWLSVNLYSLVMAVFFMLGRTNYRQAERHSLQVPVAISFGETTLRGKTADVSETGLSVVLDTAVPLQKERDLDIFLHTDRYQAYMQGNVIHVDESQQGGWKYSIQITELDTENKMQYFQIIYDRPHSLPKTIDRNLGVFDDIHININRRATPPQASRRLLPRVSVNMEVPDLNTGNPVLVEDFNYEYTMLSSPQGKQLPKQVRVELADGLVLYCVLARGKKKQKKGPTGRLYYIENWKDLLDNEAFRAISALDSAAARADAEAEREELASLLVHSEIVINKAEEVIHA